jgi:hypothetical protein
VRRKVFSAIIPLTEISRPPRIARERPALLILECYPLSRFAVQGSQASET